MTAKQRLKLARILAELDGIHRTAINAPADAERRATEFVASFPEITDTFVIETMRGSYRDADIGATLRSVATLLGDLIRYARKTYEIPPGEH